MAGGKGKAKAKKDAPDVQEDAMSVLTELFPVTHPFPDPSIDIDLIPSGDVALEQDLLLNLSNPRSWNAYIEHVKKSNRPSDRETFFRDADTRFSSVQVDLLGPLASASNRLALRRLTFVFERALAVFPTNYPLWRDYLLHRMQFVLGEPNGGLDGFWKKQIRIGKEKLDVGPALLDEVKEGDNEWDWGRATGGIGATDGNVGYREWASLAALFERALMYLPNLPRIWLLYFTVLMHPSCPPTLAYTHTRRTFDRALRTLPASLHLRIWKSYLHWAEQRGTETCLRVWRRYLRVDPSLTERYVRILEGMASEAAESAEDDEDNATVIRRTRAREAARLLLQLAKNSIDGKYVSPDGKSSYQLLIEWLELCEKYAEDVGLDVEEEESMTSGQSEEALWHTLSATSSIDAIPVSHIVRRLGLQHFPDQAGRLWTGLATFWIRRGDLDIAKDVFEEGIAAVKTVRDFTQIFDAYAETSENVMGFMMDELAELAEGDGDVDERLAKEQEVDERMKDFEDLMERRPFLINDVMLRRNQDDVQEWERRAILHGEDQAQVIATYQKAVDTINPRKATPGFNLLFIHFARYYEQHCNDLEAARNVLEKGTTVPFVRVDDLADVWCEWAEMEIRNGNFDSALRIMSRATEAPQTAAAVKAISYLDDTLTSQKRLFKSSKLWSFFIDLEESIGTIESARRTYDRMIELKIATPQVIVNYARFLEEHDYYEDSFRVYERGVDVFTYPIAFELWNIYLAKFIKRYGASKLERARDLFEQSLEKCPDKYCRPLFLMYGKLEEDFGMAKRAMSIYERATERVPSEDRFNMYLFYVAKVAANMGLAATRPVYERAIAVLPDRQTADMCVRFAQLERKLGEIDRARALYAHASQFCDPRTDKAFWSQWNAFEIEHGTEDTFREMLRIRRSVQAQFNTDASYIAAHADAQRDAKTVSAAAIDDGDDPMSKVEQQSVARNGAPLGFVAAKQTVERPDVAQDVSNAEKISGNANGGAQDDEADDDEDLM